MACNSAAVTSAWGTTAAWILFAVNGIRNCKGRRLGDGGVAEQDGVDLRGRYFLTATIDQFLDRPVSLR